MNDAIAMVRRRVQRVQFHFASYTVDDVVPRAGRDDDDRAIFNRVFVAIKDGLARTLLATEELVERMHFLADILAGLQVHEDELAILRGIEDVPEVLVLKGQPFDISDESFHITS